MSIFFFNQVILYLIILISKKLKIKIEKSIKYKKIIAVDIIDSDFEEL